MKRSMPRVSSRSGLTLLEILVCIGCLVLLVVLALPWLLTARGTSRDQMCLMRAHALATAHTAFAENNAGLVPYLVDDGGGWPVALLPFLDVPEAVPEGKPLDEDRLKELSIPKFICPEDPRIGGQKGLLSYVMNGGYGLFAVDAETQKVTEIGTHSAEIDLDGDGEVTDEEWNINYSTGVCWRPDTRPEDEDFRMAMDWISAGDGTEFTLLLTETLNARHWLSRETMDLAFVIGRGRLEFAESIAEELPLKLESADLGPFAVNGNLGTLAGHCPAPSSLHGDYVHALYVDGHGGPLSANIDPLAYARLITSNGAKYGQGQDAPMPPMKKK